MRWFVLFVCLAVPVFALSPDEMLDDPALEARARVLDHEIRCVQCQSESVASSNAAWAEEARRAIRERIVAGDSDREIKAFFVERYGEFVLMDPPKTGSTLILWLAAPLMGLLALLGGLAYLRGRSQPEPAQNGLSDEETARLKDILAQGD